MYRYRTLILYDIFYSFISTFPPNLYFSISIRAEINPKYFVFKLVNLCYYENMNELELKKELGITDFRHMSKDKLLSFASNIDKLDPEVAKAIIGQFPEFKSYMLSLVDIFKEQTNNLMESGDKVSKNTYDAIQSIINVLTWELQNTELNAEQRNKCEDRLMELAKMCVSLDEKHKNFLERILNKIVNFLVGLAGITACVLCVAIGIKHVKKKD